MYTKWTEAYGLPGQEANTVAQTLMDSPCMPLWLPSWDTQRPGPQFESRSFFGLCSLIESVRQRTMPYYPQCDGGAEQLIHTVTGAIAKVAEEQEEWNQYSLKVLLALRASTHHTYAHVRQGTEITY